ncbi:MAG: 3-deoxy-7-phosphoheptulonate synthase [Ruminococcaceae bacterium]|nr:3-deoxy-7-phosphoheptulonate synthase [Oscillospiraceae bacterium]
MIITIKRTSDAALIEQLIADFKSQGFEVHDSVGTDYHLIGLIGDTVHVDELKVKANPIVENVTRIAAPYKKANRLFHPEDTVIDVNGIKIGGNEKVVVIGGPCSVEGLDHICDLAEKVKAAGAVMLRGGAYKPRTSPYAFQGLETEGILDMVEARNRTGLPVVSELMDSDQIDEFEKYVDVIQIGARNMQNFTLLKAVGKRTTKPILLKRGLANTIEEWIMSAEYIMANGNEKVILCERGIRTFEKYTRNTLDLSVIPIIKEKTHLPIIIDPSHATGNWKYIEKMSLAAVAAGADGLIIEVHNQPECAWSDGAQCLKPEKFAQLIEKARKIAQVIGRDI